MFNSYLGNFIIGGLIASSLFYFSKQKDSVFSSIIVSIPIFFIIGYLFLHNSDGNINSYLLNTSYLWLTGIIMLLIVYKILIYIDDKIIALIIALILYIFLIYILYDNNILKN